MIDPEGRARRLIIGIGNPSRGDDALGPLAIERLATLGLRDTELLGDFQLQVEFLLDLEGREEVIFIDATVDPGVEVFAFHTLQAQRDASLSSHELSPQALLAAFGSHYGYPPPPGFVLAIRGWRFELGENLSAPASLALEQALTFLSTRLRQHA